MTESFRQGILKLQEDDTFGDARETLLYIGEEVLDMKEAKMLYAWLRSVLPCEHKGPRRGTITVGGPSKMTCNECGAEVPAWYEVP